MKQHICLMIGYACILGTFSSNVLDLNSHLLLTPLLDKGDYKMAQLQSRVKPDLGNVTSFAGFLTVNKKCGSNLFFWYFPAEKTDWKDAPLVLWVEGGVGRSSMSTIFEAIGPFEAGEDGLKKRELSWNRDNNLLFIDQPVGSGYSYTEKDCYPRDTAGVAEDVYQAVVQIHKLFPELQGNKFIIAGEGYAGHFIPALGHKIYKKNTDAEIKVNLSAIMIGNGWMDMVSQSDFGDFLYQHGLIDAAGKQEYNHFHNQCKIHVKAENWTESRHYCLPLVSDLYIKHVGYVDYFYRIDDSDRPYRKYLEPTTVGNLTYQNGLRAAEALKNESFKSVKSLFEQLLEECPVIFYNGQQDMMCGYPMMKNFIRSFSWSGQDKYLSSTRTKWCTGKGDQVGYFSGSHHLYDVLVLGTGNKISRDQPQIVFQLLSSITSGTKDNPLHGLTDCGFPEVFP